MNNKFLNISLLAAAALVTTTYQNCSQIKFAGVSIAESAKLDTETPFQFDANSKVAGVIGADGYPTENLRLKDASAAVANLVQDCSKPVSLPNGATQSRYDYEKAEALAAAAADSTNKTIPIEFAVSFGQKEDRLAYYAHKRAILSEGNDDNVSIIPVGQKSATYWVSGGKSYSAYYQVNHANAKQDYSQGKKCFFDTVSIVGDLHKTVGGHYDFLQAAETDANIIHMTHYMMYGWCDPNSTGNRCADATAAYGAGNYGADTYPNRLFDAWPHKEAGAPQIVKLFVADLRDGNFKLNVGSKHIVTDPEDKQRGAELALNVKDALDLKTIFRNRDAAIYNLSTTYTSSSTGQVFRGMKGVPQLLTNMQLAGLTGTVLASQYTPIVVDLGAEGVKTASAFGGTFFNMAAKSSTLNEVTSFDFTQQTSWLGGDLVDGLSRLPASTDSTIVADWNRQAEDGFLVLADDQGQVSSSRQMLGDNTIVNGSTYANGFLALQALAAKDCAGVATTSKYFGPWDGDLYSKKVKVWVDANRNGVVDAGELKSLADAGISAINTCNIVSAEAHDAFGNGTSLRSAFLYNDAKEVLSNDQIVSRLETGVKSTGESATFRLAIDLIFQVNEANTLE